MDTVTTKTDYQETAMSYTRKYLEQLLKIETLVGSRMEASRNKNT